MCNLQIDIGTVPIPKASQMEHLNENLDIFDFRLDPEELKQLSPFNRGNDSGSLRKPRTISTIRIRINL